MSDNRKGYKAFKKGMVCAPDEEHVKQYEEHTTYEEGGGDICGEGMMHYCVNPFDVLDHYPLVDDNGEFSDFAEVEALDEPVTDDNKKYATKKLHIGAKLSFKDFIKAGVDFLYEKTIKDMPKNNVDSGYSAKIGSSGDYAKIGSSGDYAQITVDGTDSIASAIGDGSVIQAKVSNWITLAEWKYDEEKGRCVPLCVKSVLIDGKTYKPDTWYKLENGEIVEVE